MGASDRALNHWPRVLVAPLWFWLGGLAAGAFLVGLACATFLDGSDAAAHHRLGAVAGLSAVTLGAALLTAELSRPARMWRLLVVFKWTSPLSQGVFILTAFAGCTAIVAGGSLDLLPVPGTLAGAAGLAGGLFAVGLGAYTGLLLVGSSRPLWSASLLPGPLFLTLALASGGGLHLAARPFLAPGAPPPAPLAVAACLFAAGTGALTVAWLARLRRRLGADHPRLALLVGGRLAPALWGGLTAGALVPAVLLAPVVVGGGAVAPASAGVALLLGGLALRFAVFNAEIEKR